MFNCDLFGERELPIIEKQDWLFAMAKSIFARTVEKN
jgi:hypothetical protein